MHPVLDYAPTLILIVDNPVNVLGGLLCSRFVFWVAWLELYEVFACRKDLHQRRHDKTDRVSYIAANDLALVFDFVAELLAIIIGGSGVPKPSMLFLLVEDGIIDLVLNDAMDFGVVKFSH